MKTILLLLLTSTMLRADEPQITWEPPPTIVTTNDTGLRVTNWIARSYYTGRLFTNEVPKNWNYALAITETNINLRLWDLNNATNSPVLSMAFIPPTLTSLTNVFPLFQKLPTDSYYGWISIIEDRGSNWVYSGEWGSPALFYWSNKTLFLPPRNFKFITTNTVAGN